MANCWRYVLRNATREIENDGRQCGGEQAWRNAADYMCDYLRSANCDKIIVLISLLKSPNSVRFENVYVRNVYFRNRCNSRSINVSKIYLYLYTKSATLLQQQRRRARVIKFYLYLWWRDKQDAVRKYFSMVITRTSTASIYVRRKRGYLNMIRDNANLVQIGWYQFETRLQRLCEYQHVAMNFAHCVVTVGIVTKLWISSGR